MPPRSTARVSIDPIPVAVGGLFGCFVGSFLNVVVHRLPRNESIVHPPSRCYACGTQVRWHDNLPVVGWLILRGRCRHCQAPFSFRYPLIEAACGLATALAVHLAVNQVGGPGYGWWGGSAWLHAARLPDLFLIGIALAVMLGLLWWIAASALIDLDHSIIPDELTKPLQLAAPFLAVLGNNLAIGWIPEGWWYSKDELGEFSLHPGGFLGLSLGLIGLGVGLVLVAVPLARRTFTTCVPQPMRWQEEHHRSYRLGSHWFLATLILPVITLVVVVVLTPALHGLSAAEFRRLLPSTYPLGIQLCLAILGGLAGWLVPQAVSLLGTMVFRKEAMGFGDVKFLAPLGCFLGPVGVVWTFGLAAVAGTLVGVPLLLLRRRFEVPFGPFLAVGAVLTLVLVPWLQRLLP